MSYLNFTNRTKGILFIIMAAFGFAMMSAFVKLSGDLPSFQKLFFRNIVSAGIAFILVVKNKGSFFGAKESRKILLIRSTFGTLGAFLNFYAIDYLILSDANMLNKLSPMFVIIFSALLLKEKVNKTQIFCILTAFGGALFIIKPAFNLDIIPSLAGVTGAVFAGLAYTSLRVLGQKEKFYTTVFFFSMFSVVTLAPFCLLWGEAMTPLQVFYLLCAGIFASIGQFGTTLAYKYAPSKEISIFDYTNIIFSAIISFVVFGVLPDAYSFLGYIIIFGVALYMFLYNKKLDKLTK